MKNEKIEIEVKPDKRISDYQNVKLLKDLNDDYYIVKLIKVDIKYGFYSSNLFYKM